MLIVIIIGVTLLFEIVDTKKHKSDIVTITTLEKQKANINLQKISPFDKNNNPL